MAEYTILDDKFACSILDPEGRPVVRLIDKVLAMAQCNRLNDAYALGKLHAMTQDTRRQARSTDPATSKWTASVARVEKAGLLILPILADPLHKGKKWTDERLVAYLTDSGKKLRPTGQSIRLARKILVDAGLVKDVGLDYTIRNCLAQTWGLTPEGEREWARVQASKT